MFGQQIQKIAQTWVRQFLPTNGKDYYSIFSLISWITNMKQLFIKRWNWLNSNRRVSIEGKCPYIKKSKGEGNFPSYFDNDDFTYI